MLRVNEQLAISRWTITKFFDILEKSKKLLDESLLNDHIII
jgi:hypothetical protein